MQLNLLKIGFFFSISVVREKFPALFQIFNPLVVVSCDSVRLVGVHAVTGLRAPGLDDSVTSETHNHNSRSPI